DICKFPPIGKRSVAGGYPHFDYRPVALAESVRELNDVCLLVCMIETTEGLENVEAIAAVDGVDVLHLGTNDLLAAMGKPGQFDDPVVIAAQDRVIKAARAHGKIAGCGGNRDVARQLAAIRRGARFVTTQTDVGFLAAAARQWNEDGKQGLAERGYHDCGRRRRRGIGAGKKELGMGRLVRWLAGLWCVGALALASPGSAETVKIVVPFAPGGPVDQLARILSNDLRTKLGADVIVE